MSHRLSSLGAYTRCLVALHRHTVQEIECQFWGFLCGLSMLWVPLYGPWVAGGCRYASTAFGFVLCFGPYVCWHNLQLACSCSARTHKCHRVGHGVLGGLVMLGLCYLCAGLALIVAKVDIVSQALFVAHPRHILVVFGRASQHLMLLSGPQVCLGYTGHFFDDLPECRHTNAGPYLGLTVAVHNNSTKNLFLIGE